MIDLGNGMKLMSQEDLIEFGELVATTSLKKYEEKKSLDNLKEHISISEALLLLDGKMQHNALRERLKQVPNLIVKPQLGKKIFLYKNLFLQYLASGKIK